MSIGYQWFRGRCQHCGRSRELALYGPNENHASWRIPCRDCKTLVRMIWQKKQKKNER